MKSVNFFPPLENNFQESKCQDVIQQMIKCCKEKRYAERDVRCSGFIKKT